jgi:cytochrome c-type biogenesis protein CcmH
MKNKIFNFFSKFILFLIIIILQTSSNNTFSLEPEEILENTKLETRARSISKNIRCMVCQNQSIDESSAPLAKDLRILIRNKVVEGYSDGEIYKYLSSRYGDFILLNPPLKLITLGLWCLPLLFIFFGIYIIYSHNKKSKKN